MSRFEDTSEAALAKEERERNPSSSSLPSIDTKKRVSLLFQTATSPPASPGLPASATKRKARLVGTPSRYFSAGERPSPVKNDAARKRNSLEEAVPRYLFAEEEGTVRYFTAEEETVPVQICMDCGASNNGSHRFCTECGKPRKTDATAAGPKVESVEAVKSFEAVKSVEAVTSVETAKSVEAVTSVETAKSVKAVRSVKAVKSVEALKIAGKYIAETDTSVSLSLPSRAEKLDTADSISKATLEEVPKTLEVAASPAKKAVAIGLTESVIVEESTTDRSVVLPLPPVTSSVIEAKPEVKKTEPVKKAEEEIVCSNLVLIDTDRSVLLPLPPLTDIIETGSISKATLEEVTKTPEVANSPEKETEADPADPGENENGVEESEIDRSVLLPVPPIIATIAGKPAPDVQAVYAVDSTARPAAATTTHGPDRSVLLPLPPITELLPSAAPINKSTTSAAPIDTASTRTASTRYVLPTAGASSTGTKTDARKTKPVHKKFCTNCGTANKGNHKFCTECGNSMENTKGTK